MSSLIDRIISDILEKGAPTTKRRWAKRLEAWELPNRDLPPFKSTRRMDQVITKVGETLVVRFFETWDGHTYEPFRAVMDDFLEVYKYKPIGRSQVWAYQPATMQMGYDEYDQVYKWKSHIIDEAGEFPHLPLDKAKFNAMVLLKRDWHFINGLEILIKQGYVKLAGLVGTVYPGADIQNAMKYNRELMKNPSVNKIEFAEQANFKYQRGMLKCPMHYLKRCMQEIGWKDLKAYAKQQGKAVNQLVVDYAGYLEHRKQYNMALRPDDLYRSKEIIRVFQECERKRKLEVEHAMLNHKISKRELPSVNVNGFIIKPFRSADDLAEEGDMMHHCIYDYREKYATGKKDLFSMRDTKSNKRIASIEIDPQTRKPIQCRGKFNKNLEGIYKKEISALINAYERI